MRRASLTCAWLLALAFWAVVPTTHAESLQPFEFALIGDPQIGYGRGGEYADAGHFGEVIENINTRKVPLSIIAGDLVQDRIIWQEWIFGWELARMQRQVVLAPGNHDIVDEGSLAAYRKRHGKDYFDVVYQQLRVHRAQLGDDARSRYFPRRIRPPMGLP